MRHSCAGARRRSGLMRLRWIAWPVWWIGSVRLRYLAGSRGGCRCTSAAPSDVRIVSMMAEHVIVSDPDVMSGTPCFRGTRVPFKNLIDYLEGGHSLGEFLRQFPTVTHEMAIQALEEAKDSLLSRIA